MNDDARPPLATHPAPAPDARDTDASLPSVLISNGFSHYPMAGHAAAVAALGRLDGLITGAYPGPRVRAAAKRSRLAGHAKLGRLLDRREALPDDLVISRWQPEVLAQLAGPLWRQRRLRRFGISLTARAQRWYGRSARAAVARSGAGIYHYRAGFGGASVDVARRRGMIALCQHTVAHPMILDYLVTHGGRFPEPGDDLRMDALMDTILRDIERADVVMTDCDFVRRTFVHQGWAPEQVHVLEPGIDQNFLDLLPPRPPRPAGTPTRLLFAGAFEERKGVTALMEALGQLQGDWRLQIAGHADPPMLERYAHVLADPRIEQLGLIRRGELARIMTETDVLVFPSLAEGSARVNWEALVAGCYVINTPNSGSIVVDGEHGAVVPPGDAPALAAAIQWTIEHPDQAEAIGRRNAQVVPGQYSQARYGERLVALYDLLIATTDAAAPTDRTPPVGGES